MFMITRTKMLILTGGVWNGSALEFIAGDWIMGLFALALGIGCYLIAKDAPDRSQMLTATFTGSGGTLPPYDESDQRERVWMPRVQDEWKDPCTVYCDISNAHSQHTYMCPAHGNVWCGGFGTGE